MRRIVWLAVMAAVWAGPADARTNHWAREISLGVNATKGNSDTQLVKAEAKASQEGVWDMGVDGSYARSEGETKTEKAKGHLQYDEAVGARLYAGARVSAEYDGGAGLKYRVVAGPVAGLYLLREGTMDLSVEAGPSFIGEKKGDDREEYAAVRAAQKFSKNWSDRSKAWESVEYVPDLRGGDNYVVESQAGIEAAINSSLGLKVTVTHKYTAEPAEDKEREDVELVTSLTYRF